MPEFAVTYIDRMIKYNVFGGKLNRGLQVLDTVSIMKKNKPSEEDIKIASICGWGIEWFF